MKIVELKCKNCHAEYETLESVPTEALKCPGCGKDEFDITKTDREFKGCGGGCSGGCDSCK
jgi:Zn finger protein HypA/HybF involved in hydrogenase expression